MNYNILNLAGRDAAVERYAIYARFSSALQKPTSIADQMSLCTHHVRGLGGAIAAAYTDAMHTGATMRQRDGLHRLISDARKGRFDWVFTEALDRISRNQADAAYIYQLLRFYNVGIHTVEEGEVNEMHIGIKGLMNQAYLEALAAKTRRGQRAAVKKGRVPCGKTYGYRIANVLRDDGKAERGLREIEPGQAAAVRRIFELYASGDSARRIAATLNAEGVPSPGGGEWSSLAINGNRKRRNGILQNEIYLGRIVYNRQTFVRHPETGKRQARPNPRKDWLVQEAPHLRIVSDELWRQVELRRDAGAGRRPGGPGKGAVRPLSGLIKCRLCRGRMKVEARAIYRCWTRREKGTCANDRGIAARKLEERTAEALLEWAVRRRDWPRLIAAAARETAHRRDILGRRLERNNGAIQRLVRAIETGGYAPRVHARILQLEQAAANMKLERDGLAKPPAKAPEDLARQLVERLRTLLFLVQRQDGPARQQALLTVRGLVRKILVKPLHRPGKTDLEVVPCKAGLVALALRPAETKVLPFKGSPPPA